MWRWNWFGNFMINDYQNKLLTRSKTNSYGFILMALVFFLFYAGFIVPVLRNELFSAMFWLFSVVLFFNVIFVLKAIRVIWGESLWFDKDSDQVVLNGKWLCSVSRIQGFELDNDIILGNEYRPYNNVCLYHLYMVLPNERRICLMSTFNELSCKELYKTLRGFQRPNNPKQEAVKPPAARAKRRSKRRKK